MFGCGFRTIRHDQTFVLEVKYVENSGLLNKKNPKWSIQKFFFKKNMVIRTRKLVPLNT
jgi:hypothetical protein